MYRLRLLSSVPLRYEYKQLFGPISLFLAGVLAVTLFMLVPRGASLFLRSNVR